MASLVTTMGAASPISPGTMAKGMCVTPAWAYNAFSISNTSTVDEAAATCSAACTQDMTLCWGFFLKAPAGPDDASPTAAELEAQAHVLLNRPSHYKLQEAGKFQCVTLSG